MWWNLAASLSSKTRFRWRTWISDRPEIVGLGEPLIEMVRLPDPVEGRTAYVQGFGGDTCTAIIAAARQGARTGYISALGDDMFGEALRTLWAREGVDHAHVLTNGQAETGVCFINPDPAGRRFTYARKGSAARRYGPEDIPEAYIANARVLHLSGITLAISETMRAAALRAVEIARDAEVMVSYDLNHRPALWSRETALEVLEELLPQIDIVFPSDDEARLLFGDNDPGTVADRFLDVGARCVLVKRGAEGAYMATGKISAHIPAAPSTPVDSAGAGDSFAGAFLAWYLETGDPERAAREAAKVAAATVSGLGAIDAVPRRTGT